MQKLHAFITVSVMAVLIGIIYHWLNEMGWQFALGVLFGTVVYQVGYYCKTGTFYGP